jgi:arylsulfatase A-like enzyme
MRWIAALIACCCSLACRADDRPNIVWIIVEDMSAHFSCYGETTIRTPNVDRMAAEGVRFDKAFVTAPICSISRSALITGMYQTSIGAQNHRSGRGVEKIHLPAGVKLIPQLFKEAGYHTSNGSLRSKGKGIAKTDYNFEWDPSAVYDGNDWSARKPGQPFFTQVQLSGGKYRGDGSTDKWAQQAKKELGSNTDPAAVKLPPYYPNHPVILQDWANYLDTVRKTDQEVGQILDRLRAEGVLDRTVVFFITDHGVSHARGKQFLYDEGTRIPFVVRGPGIPRGVVRGDLIEHIDMAAMSLALAGIPIPSNVQGRNALAADYQPRRHVFAARDRADETVDHIRMVRSDRYKYIRNYLPDRPHLQPNNYKDNKAILQAIRQWEQAGKLDAAQSLVTAKTRAPEELYDLAADPWEIRNLAGDPAHRATLESMRAAHEQWVKDTGDRGREPEPMKMYDSDMAAYVGEAKKDSARRQEVLRNIDQMKKWAAEGK